MKLLNCSFENFFVKYTRHQVLLSLMTKGGVTGLEWFFDIIKMIAANVLSKYVGKWFDQLLKKLW